MQSELVGHVKRLWRYPIKSMLGESPGRLIIGPSGVVGDRGYALWDRSTARVASAKNPRFWKQLLAFTAEYTCEPVAGEPLPTVSVTGPMAGVDEPAQTRCTDDPSLMALLSTTFGRDISLLDFAPPGASLDQYWPDVPERDFQNVTTELKMPEGTFFDACSIHAISTATLEALKQREPDLDFAVERFRPNLLIEPTQGKDGFVEEGWVGGLLTIGEQLQLHVDGGCPRCVVTTLAQGNLPEEMGILRATAQHNKVTAGIRLSVVTSGAVEIGDPVHLSINDTESIHQA